MKDRITLVCSLAILLGSLAGCLPEDEIVRHRIPKSRSGLDALRTSSEVKTEAADPTDRMVVGLFALPEVTWFFKINGSIDQVKKTEPQWRSFMTSVQFEDGQPKWELPEGWSEGGKRPMRFATLIMGEEKPPLEMAISSLGPDQDLVLNVNRWRGQMGLNSITESDLDGSVTKLDFDVGSAWLFDVRGSKSGSMAPFANRPMVNNPQSTSNAANTSKSTVEYQSPDGWQDGRTSSMVSVRLKKSDGEKNAQITVIRLPADANEWAPNVTRWAREIGLSDLSTEELEKRTSEIEVDGAKGNLLRLIEDETEKATIGCMIKQDQIAWFIKLTGDKNLVSENEAAFSDFMGTIKFPSSTN